MSVWLTLVLAKYKGRGYKAEAGECHISLVIGSPPDDIISPLLSANF
jgi:hypothetical protein